MGVQQQRQATSFSGLTLASRNRKQRTLPSRLDLRFGGRLPKSGIIRIR